MIGRCQTNSRNQTRSHSGLTLLDLVVTLFILGILVAVIAPRFNQSLQRQRCDASARRLVADLQRARQHALTSSTAVTVTFDLTAETYSFPSVISNPDRSGDQYMIGLSEDPWLTDLSSVERGGIGHVAGTIDLQFLGSGVCDADFRIVMNSAGLTRTIVVSGTTGRTKLLSHAGG